MSKEAKELSVKIDQIKVMCELVDKVPKTHGHNLKHRALGDLDRIANSAWLNIYEYLHDNGIEPDKYFNKKENDEKEGEENKNHAT